jgi:hypothetical protein
MLCPVQAWFESLDIHNKGHSHRPQEWVHSFDPEEIAYIMEDMAVLWENQRQSHLNKDGVIDEDELLKVLSPRAGGREGRDYSPGVRKALLEFHAALVEADASHMLWLETVIDSVKIQNSINRMIKLSADHR